MSNRHPASFAKRQREAAKRAKRVEKAEKRALRKADRTTTGVSGAPVGHDSDFETEPVEADAAEGESAQDAPSDGLVTPTRRAARPER